MIKLLLISFCAAAITAKNFTNPISELAPDPWMVFHNGYYHLIATTWENYFGIRKSKTLEGLKTVENKVVYTFDGHTGWAPEIHQVDGKWYLYYAGCAGPKGNDTVNCHRNYVAESAGDDPMGPYTFKAALTDPDDGDQMQLDPSMIKINGNLYLLGSYVASTQNLYIRALSNPYTPAGHKRLLSTPTFDWEKQGWTVNEGPEPLYHDNRVFVVYSASYCGTPDYKLGLIEFVGTDPLNIDHWKKHPSPVFQRSDEHQVYGPGHNGFFKSPDGTEDWIVYHAVMDTGAHCWMDRSSRAQKFTWGSDGLPVFGEPDAVGVAIQVPSGEES